MEETLSIEKYWTLKKIPNHLNEYRTVLSNLRNLLFLCNSDYLPHNFIEVLYKFFSSWFKLRNRFNISTTPKINIILHHLELFWWCWVNIKTMHKRVHQFVYKRMMKGYNVKKIISSKHGDMLFNLVRRINCYNLKV